MRHQLGATRLSQRRAHPQATLRHEHDINGASSGDDYSTPREPAGSDVTINTNSALYPLLSQFLIRESQPMRTDGTQIRT